MFKKIVIGVMVVSLIFFGVVAMQPSTFLVTRSATIDAPPAVVFEQVNDLHKWQEWSPWAKRDPNAKATFEGPPAGEGAIFRWAGNDEVGEGSMTITESHPGERVKFQLDFVKPFEGTNEAEFTFKPEGEKTVVTWNMTGENNFISKAICMFMDMDKMVGGDFETGLAQMKTIAEAEAKKTGEAPAKAETPEPAAPAQE